MKHIANATLKWMQGVFGHPNYCRDHVTCLWLTYFSQCGAWAATTWVELNSFELAMKDARVTAWVQVAHQLGTHHAAQQVAPSTPPRRLTAVDFKFMWTADELEMEDDHSTTDSTGGGDVEYRGEALESFKDASSTTGNAPDDVDAVAQLDEFDADALAQSDEFDALMDDNGDDIDIPTAKRQRIVFDSVTQLKFTRPQSEVFVSNDLRWALDDYLEADCSSNEASSNHDSEASSNNLSSSSSSVRVPLPQLPAPNGATDFSFLNCTMPYNIDARTNQRKLCRGFCQKCSDRKSR